VQKGYVVNARARSCSVRWLFVSALLLISIGARPALAQRPPSGSTAIAKALAPDTPAPVAQGAGGAVDAGGGDTASLEHKKQDSASVAADANCSPNCPPKQKPEPWLMLLAFVIAMGLMYAVHFFDSYHAYKFSTESRDKLLAATGGHLSPSSSHW
jgi:hypothetical protein